MTTLALTGATGFVGQALCDLALAQGWRLRALTRRSQPARERLEWISGDLNDTAALACLCDGASALLHIAGVVNAPDPAGFIAGNVTGTANVLAAATAAGVPRLVHVSSLAAREPQLSNYGASKRRAEDLVAASPLDWTVVRPPGVYGPRDTEMLMLFRAARSHLVPVPPGGRIALIHVDDLARLLLALIPTGADVSHQLFEPDDGTSGGLTHPQMVTDMARAQHTWARALPLPRWLLLALGHADRLARGPRAQLTPDRVNYMCHPDWTADPARRPPVSRWAPAIARAEGFAATVGWYRAAGWLK